jgi:hypothetical protein
MLKWIALAFLIIGVLGVVYAMPLVATASFEKDFPFEVVILVSSCVLVFVALCMFIVLLFTSI